METIITFTNEKDPVWIIYKKEDLYGVAVQIFEYTFEIEVYGSIEDCKNYIKTRID